MKAKPTSGNNAIKLNNNSRKEQVMAKEKASSLTKVRNFIIKRKKPVLALCSALILIASISYFAQIRQQQIAEKHDKALGSGLNAYSKGKFDQAIKDLEEASKLNPRDDKTRLNLGQSYEAQGKLDKALEEYKASLKVNPNQPHAYYNIAIIYKSQAKIEEAIQSLEKAIELDKDFVAARVILGDLYGLQGEYDKAEEQYLTVIKMEPFGLDLEELKAKLGILRR